MKTNSSAITTIVKLANGVKLYAEIAARCAIAEKSLRELSRESQVSLATIWRMREAKTVANLKPLVKIESVFKRWGV